MLRRGRIGEGWLGELYAGEDTQGRLVRLIAMAELTAEQRDWVLQRHRLMTRVAIVGACPQIGAEFVNGTLYWVGAWREAVQLSLVLEEKYLPNSVIMSIASSLIESLASAEQQGVSHGCLDPNAIWLGRDGQVWIDGYGEVFQPETATKDVYDVGRLTIEMFLGACPFPIEDASEAKQALIQTGVELKALGLPGKLPRQILQMVLWEPDKRPTIQQVRDRWKISRASEIIGRWVQEHFEHRFAQALPEDRLPTSERIAPPPFHPDLIEDVEEQSIALPEIGLFNPSHDVTAVIEPFDDDDTFLLSREEDVLEDTQRLPLEISKGVVEEEISLESQDEITQEIAFFSEAENAFFDFDLEETSQLSSDESPRVLQRESVELENPDVELEVVMDVPSRRPWMGIVWIALIGILTAGGLFWTIPSIPSVAEIPQATIETVATEPVALLPIQTPTVEVMPEIVQVQDEVIEEAIVAEPEPESPVERPVVQETPKKRVTTQSETRTPESTKPKSQVVESQKPVRKTVVKEKPVQTIEQKVEEPIESIEPVETVEPMVVEEPVAPEPPANGVVKVIGDAAVIRLKKDGQERRGGGEYAPGTYDVYVTFEGFSEFQLTALTVVSGQTHIVKCNAMFATCQYK